MNRENASALRFFRYWVKKQKHEYDEFCTGIPYASSMFDRHDPDNLEGAANLLMDILTLGEDSDDHEPFHLACVRDNIANTRFLFEDGSVVDFGIGGEWWQISGQLKMSEAREYAYDKKSGKIKLQVAAP